MALVSMQRKFQRMSYHKGLRYVIYAWFACHM